MFKGIIFDFFGTLSSEVAPTWLKKHCSTEEIAELRQKYIEPADNGDLNESDFFAALSQATTVPPETIRQEWLQIVQLKPDMMDLVKRLRADYKLAILSDTPSPFFREILRTNDIAALFDVIVVSAEIHMTKADDGAYETVLRELGITAEQAIMVDDNPANIRRANALGITGFVFTGYEQFKNDLTGVGVGKASGEI